jgi:putative ABC transport system permease protein
MRNEFLSMNYTPSEEDFADWKFQPLNNIHLESDNFYWVGETGGSRRNLSIFMLIGLLVLGVAIINYVNLATARAGQRAKEVGVKKVTGAERGQLTIQFITESIVQAVLSATIALLLAELLLPFFNTVTNRELSILGSQPLLFIGGILILALLTGLLAGIYPAFVMSGYRPVKALKANFMKSGDKGMFRKVLVTGQFCITIALVIVMAFIYRQVNFMMDHELGFHPDQVMTVPFNNRHNFHKLEDIKTRLENIPGVKTVTTASRFPGGFMPDWGVIIEGNPDAISPNVIFADEDYASTLDIEMVEGRFISDDIAADSINNFFVNETFVRENALDNPIGTKLKFTADSTYGQIVGVMKDFHFQGLFQDINPLVMTGAQRRYIAGFKLSTQNMSKTIAEVERLWAEIEPEHPMRYTFLDEEFANQYASQERFGETMLNSTLLKLFIAQLGLFGLTVFKLERRTREIGIRKVLGATVGGVIGLLSKDFLKLAGIAFLIALPIGYFISKSWLEDFAYRTDLAWWVFVGAGLLIGLVGFLTVGIQSMRAALMNPVESLRSE